MAFAVNNIVRVAARQLLDGTDDVVNVYHFIIRAIDAAGDPDVLQEIQERIAAAYLEIQPEIPNNVTANVLDIYNVTQDVPYGQIPWSSSYTGGTGAGSQNASGVACLVLWTTNVKRVQGRTYLGPFTVGAMADGVWSGGTITNVANYTTAMRFESPIVTTSVLGLIIWSDGAGLARNISGRRISEIPAYQRRRRKGRGS